MDYSNRSTDDLINERNELGRVAADIGVRIDEETRNRNLPIGQQRRDIARMREAYDTTHRVIGEITSELESRRPVMNSPFSTREADNRAAVPLPDVRGPVLIDREQRDGMARWARARYPRQHEHRGELSFGRILHGLVTGNYTDAPEELRAIGEGTSAAGGVLVPAPVASDIIDRARNQARVFQAGARLVPMDSKTLTLPRLTGEVDPTTKWRNEAATISEDNLTFDSVTLTAQSLAFYVRASRELIEDASAGGSVESVVRNSFAEVVALEIDRVALLGTGTAPQPRGLLNQTGVVTTSHGANGTAIGPLGTGLGWDFLIDAVATVRSANFEPSGIVYAVRTEQSLSKLKDTTNNYAPPPVGLPPRYPTKQVPINVTTGTSTDTSYVFTGDFSNLLVGMRTSMSLQVLQERFADTGQVAFLCWVRADVAVAQPLAFNIDAGVRG